MTNPLGCFRARFRVDTILCRRRQPAPRPESSNCFGALSVDRRANVRHGGVVDFSIRKYIDDGPNGTYISCLSGAGRGTI